MMNLIVLLVASLSLVYSFQMKSNYNNKMRLQMKVEEFDAILFDCDGVIAETERDVHRISFNQAFAHKGLKNEWDVDLYGKLLKIGGGKERMTGE